MPAVARNTHGDGDPGLSAPITAVVSIASAVVALTLGVLAWRFIVRRGNKDAPLAPPSTKFPPPRLLQKPKPTHFAASVKGQDYANQIHSPPPAYSPESMKSPPISNKKSAPVLNLNITDCDIEETQPSPLRSASFNPSLKTQSWTSRVSSRISMGTKKLPRLMTVVTLYVPSLSDELLVRLGETLRMIEEYEDEWCLVQRVGQTDERGVIPRFCLIERPEIIPRTGKRASSGPLLTSTFRK